MHVAVEQFFYRIYVDTSFSSTTGYHRKRKSPEFFFGLSLFYAAQILIGVVALFLQRTTCIVKRASSIGEYGCALSRTSRDKRSKTVRGFRADTFPPIYNKSHTGRNSAKQGANNSAHIDKPKYSSSSSSSTSS